MTRADLPYAINDADNHFNEPPDCFERYIDPSRRRPRDPLRHRARRLDSSSCSRARPSKFHSEPDHVLERRARARCSGHGRRRRAPAVATGRRRARRVPGMLLNRLNPLKGLDDEERKDAHRGVPTQGGGIRQSRSPARAHGRAGHRQGAHVPRRARTTSSTSSPTTSLRCTQTSGRSTAGCTRRSDTSSDNRMFLPPYIAFADPDLAVRSSTPGDRRRRADDPDQVGPRARWTATTRSAAGRSPIRSSTGSGRSVNEAEARLAVHLGGTDYQKYGADWSEDPDAVFGDFDAFQWMMYWGDRPAMELTAGADPAQLLRPLPEHAGLPLREGHGVAAVHPAQDRPRVPARSQGEVGGERAARPRPSRSSASTSWSRPSRRRTSERVVDEVGHRARSCSAPTSRTAKAWRTRRSTSARNSLRSPTTTSAGSCATTSPTTSPASDTIRLDGSRAQRRSAVLPGDGAEVPRAGVAAHRRCGRGRRPRRASTGRGGARRAELGFTSFLVPEADGGGSLSGAGLLDLVIVAEEMGRARRAGPARCRRTWPPAAVAADGSAEQRARLLPGHPRGRARGRGVAPSRPSTAGSDATRRGHADAGDDVRPRRPVQRPVEAGAQADESCSRRRPSRPRASPSSSSPPTPRGVTVTPLEQPRSRRAASPSVRLDAVRLPASTVVGAVGGAAAAVERQLHARGRAAVRRVGRCSRPRLRAHARVPRRPLLVRTPARVVPGAEAPPRRHEDLARGARTVSRHSPRVRCRTTPPTPPSSCTRRRAYVGDHATELVQQCVQLHGGIGVTWEHDLHLYLRRVTAQPQPARHARRPPGAPRRLLSLRAPGGRMTTTRPTRRDERSTSSGPGPRLARREHRAPPRVDDRSCEEARRSGTRERELQRTPLGRRFRRDLLPGGVRRPRASRSNTSRPSPRRRCPTSSRSTSACRRSASSPRRCSSSARQEQKARLPAGHPARRPPVGAVPLRTDRRLRPGRLHHPGRRATATCGCSAVRRSGAPAAHAADYAMCLARTNWDVPKHAGLTMFIVELHQPRIRSSRSSQVNGVKEFCQEFLDDVELPADAVVGEVNDGWTVASRLLSHERNAVGGGSPYVSGRNPSPRAPAGHRDLTPLDLAATRRGRRSRSSVSSSAEARMIDLVQGGLIAAGDRSGIAPARCPRRSAAILKLFSAKTACARTRSTRPSEVRRRSPGAGADDESHDERAQHFLAPGRMPRRREQRDPTQHHQRAGARHAPRVGRRS